MHIYASLCVHTVRTATLSRIWPKSALAASVVLLGVRLLLEAMRQTASGFRGRVEFLNAVFMSVAFAPGVDIIPKESFPSGIFTNPSAIAPRWETPTTRMNFLS